MDVRIAILDESMIDAAAPLVIGYLHSSPDGMTQAKPAKKQYQELLGRIKRNLSELLKSGLASIYVAQVGREIAAYILLSWGFSIGKGRPVLRVDALYTLPEYRNRGIGRKLMEFAVDMAESNHAARMQLETDDCNAPAQTLYTNIGFERIEGKEVFMKFL